MGCVCLMCVLQPGSEKSRAVELEKGLAGSLSKTLEVVEDGSTLLDYYKGEGATRWALA